MNTVAKVEEVEDPDEAARQQRIKDKPLLSQCYNLMDFESVAKSVMKKVAWGYYSSAADDEIVRNFPNHLFVLCSSFLHVEATFVMNDREILSII